MDLKGNDVYRKSPFIIQAASYGDLDCFRTLLAVGCKLTDHGYICLSKKKKNQVISNVVGAAAFNGNKDILNYVHQ